MLSRKKISLGSEPHYRRAIAVWKRADRKNPDASVARARCKEKGLVETFSYWQSVKHRLVGGPGR